MLDKMRARTRSWITYLIFGAIIVVFVVAFGPGANGCADMRTDLAATGYAARVNGQELSMADFNRAYGNAYRQYQSQLGERFTPEMAEQFRLKDQVLDQLVQRELLVDTAKAQGISASDEEVIKVIQEIPAFQKDGVFDFPTYEAVVQGALGLQPEQFEEQVRGDILRGRVLAQLRQAAKVTDEEAKAEFNRDNDRADITFVRFAVPEFQAGVAPTAAQVQAFLATPEGKKRIEEEYNRQSARFKTPKQVRAQHILVKVAEDAPPNEVAAAKARIEEARKRIEGGADFGEVAKETSEDAGSKDKGGDLGLFGPGQMVKPFEDAAMALKPGQLSEPVRSRFGFHLIKVTEVKEPTVQALEQVQGEIAKELLAVDGAKIAARAAAEKALATAKAKGTTLATMFPKPEPKVDEHGHEAPAPPTGPVAEDSGSFSLGSDYVPRLGIAADVVRAVAGANAGQFLPDVYEVSGSYVIIHVNERLRPDPTAFAEKRDTYLQRVRQKKEDILEQGFLRNLRENARVETNPQLFAQQG